MKILFLIRSLDAGGAERQLIELVRNLDKSRFEPLIVTFYEGGLLKQELINEKNVSLLSLKKSGRRDLVHFLIQLFQITRREHPDLIHGYLDVPNLFALLVGRLCGIKVFWGLRASDIDLSNYDWTANFTFRLSALLSSFADGIIVNSQAGRQYHISRGFSPKHMMVISNGIDTNRFFPDQEARSLIREKWGCGENKILVGQVGRLDPMKAPEQFIEAAAKIAEIYPDIQFVYVTGGPEGYRQRLEKMAADLGLSEKIYWPGLQFEMKAVYNAFDILTLSSIRGEGFPNVVGEAMACGIPCVVSDVGDAAWIVGESGIVVQPLTPDALFQGIKKMLLIQPEIRKAMGLQARQRIMDLFSTQALILNTEEVMLNTLKSNKRSPSP